MIKCGALGFTESGSFKGEGEVHMATVTILKKRTKKSYLNHPFDKSMVVFLFLFLFFCFNLFINLFNLQLQN